MSRNLEISGTQKIADAFVDLTRNIHEVTLCFEGRGIHYPISVATVDRDAAICVLDITSLGDIDERLAASRPPFVLRARQSSATLYSAPMTIAEVLRRGPRLGLRCRLPERCFLTHKRWDFRAEVAAGMRVDVRLGTPEGETIDGTLGDLSVGGCRVDIACAAADRLAVDDRRYQFRARFPNQEVFEAISRVRYRTEDTDAARATIGLAFDIGLFDIERQAWFYVREIERETTRQTKDRSHRPRLAPSRLFPGNADSGAPDACPRPPKP